MSASRTVSICVVICTFKRERFVLANLETLRENKDVFSHVVIVDNARTLDASMGDGFAEIIPNRNLGGSGGFTRGLMRAHELGYSHVLLMDDDISFARDPFEKAKAMLEKMPEGSKEWIGFAMHPLNAPNMQYELGSKWNGVKMVLNNHDLDMDDPKSIEINRTHQVYNYSAWWSLIMPTSVVDDYGLPMPFFIKFDDIEYGLRRKGEPILFDSDLYILHEDFRTKYNPYLEYYLCRNALITNALHFKGAWFLSQLRYFYKTLKFMFTGHIIEMKLATLGVSDFLKGPVIFIAEDIAAKNDFIRKTAGRKIAKFPYAIGYLFQAIGHSFYLLFAHHGARRKWREKYPYLTSAAYWNEVFNQA